MVVRIRTVLAIPQSWWYLCFSAFFALFLNKYLYRVRGVSINIIQQEPEFTYFDSCLVRFLLLWYFCLWSKRKVFLVLMFHFDFPANVCFFLSSGWLYRRILVLQMFPVRGVLPYLALTVMYPWAGHGFQGLGPESFIRMWRLDICMRSLHLWYQQFLTKKSNSKMLVWKIAYFCMRNETNQGANISRPRRENVTQTFLECTPQV